MASGQRREAFGAYYFVVEIEGERFASFRSAGGLKSEGEVVPLMEGGWNAAEHKLVGRTKYPNIVLKQGSAGPEMWRKRQRFISDSTGDLRRFDGAIIQLGPNGKTIATWTFTNAWICKWEAPDWDAGKNEIAIETIEIVHEGLALNGVGPTPPRSKNASGAKSASKASAAKQAAAAAGQSAAAGAKGAAASAKGAAASAAAGAAAGAAGAASNAAKAAEKAGATAAKQASVVALKAA